MDKSIKKNAIIVIIIFLIALVFRIIYIQVTPYNVRQHDLEFQNKGGGLDYIRVINETGRLPNSNKGQYYHPPLYYMSAALWMKIISIFTRNSIIMYESLQWQTLIYSMILVYVLYRILVKLKFIDRYIYLILLAIALNPTLIILSGTINNDILSVLLIFGTLLRLIKWYEKSDAKNTALLAIITGMSVMTKTSRSYVCYTYIICCNKKICRRYKKMY